MPDVYVAAGSNVDPRRHLRLALELLRDRYGPLRRSRAYANPAVGFAGEDFVNLVVGFATCEAPACVLDALHAVEEACDRPRDAPKWAPRTMDLDLLLYGDLVCEQPGLTLPRPDLVRKPYMLGPLAEIAPRLEHPTLGRTMAELWRDFDRQSHALIPISLSAEDAGTHCDSGPQ